LYKPGLGASSAAIQATSDPSGAGVSELRINYGLGYRVYSQNRGTVLIILLAGGDKSTQAKDIKSAQDLARNFKEDE
jgi:putative addiction module killer protein